MITHVLMILLALTAVTPNVFKNSSMEGSILYGDEVPIAKFPFAVFLELRMSHPASCGASLIMVQVIITAATCLTEMTHRRGRVVAYLGNELPINAMCIRQVVNYRNHNNYREYRQTNNLAVAFLEAPVKLGRLIKKIPLIDLSVGERETGYGVGWGDQIYPKQRPDHPNRRLLRCTQQRIMTHEECRERISNPRLPETVMCSVPVAGHFYKSDAGSGLVFFMTSRSSPMYLGAVFSHIIDEVAIYTTLTSNRVWIFTTSIELFEETCKKELSLRRSHGTVVENATCTVQYFNKTNDEVKIDECLE